MDNEIEQKLDSPASHAGEADIAQDSATGARPSRKKQKSIFSTMDPVSSDAAALGHRDLSSKAAIDKIKKAGVKHEGKKVVTDDVKKLKSIEIDPGISELEQANHYREPIRIEYYIPKDSRFVVETRYLHIPLIDPVPEEKHQVLRDYMDRNLFFDVLRIMDENPQYITDILDAYANSMDLMESLARHIREAKFEPELYKPAFYICEALAEYEPTIVSLEILGEFVAWNLNWLVRQMNHIGIEFSASDKTVSYFIKLRNIHHEENSLPYDERFEILAALFYEQAFPNRGMELEEDYYYDIFDMKKINRNRNRTRPGW